MVSRRIDGISGVLLLIVSIAMLVATFSFQTMTEARIGSDFMPRVVAGLLAAMSLILIVSAYRKRGGSAEECITATTEEELDDDSKSYRTVIYSVLLMVGYLALMPFIGFLVTTAVFLFLKMWLFSDKSKKKFVIFIAISIIASAVTYFVFRSIFYVMLPVGILG